MKKSAFIVFLFIFGVSLAAAVKAQTITTIAGGGPNLLPATVSNIDAPQGVALDAVGNAFIVTPNQVYKVDTNGLLTIYAGRGFAVEVSGGDGGPATQADFVFAEGAAVDSKGNLFISDDLAGEIRRVDTSTHTITTYATVFEPHGLALDKQNNLYIADSAGMVWRVDAKTHALTMFAGQGNPGDPVSPDGGPPTNIGAPSGVAFDSHGNLFVSDSFNGAVYRLDSNPAHTLTTILTGLPKFTMGIATDKTGNVYVADVLGFVSRWDASSHAVTTIAADAGLDFPLAVAVRNNSTLYIADSHNNRVPAVDLRSSTVTIFAGNCVNNFCPPGFSGDGYDASQASLAGPSAFVTDVFGNLYISDTNNNVVRRVSAQTQTITTYAGNAFLNPLITSNLGDGGAATAASLDAPEGLAFDLFGNLYIADTLHSRVRAVDFLFHRINTVVGSGQPPVGCDTGPASSTNLEFPSGLGSDLFGNLFITDLSDTPCIKRLDAFTRNVSQYADLYADGILLSLPTPMARDSAGNLYVAGAFVIAKIDTHQHVTVVAGDPNNGCLGDPLQEGVPATTVSLCFPSGVAVDSGGNIYLSDPVNNVVRQVDASTQRIFTVAGTGVAGFSGDGGQATNAQLSAPGGLFIDSSGNLYIADAGNKRVRKVTAPSHH